MELNQRSTIQNIKLLRSQIKHIFYKILKSRSMLGMVGMVERDHLTVRSELTLLNRVQQWFDQFCLQYVFQFGWSQNQIYRVNLALAEGFTNAVRHAHRTLPPETTIEIEVSLWADRMEIRIWDHGKPFDPNVIVEPQPGNPQVGGYGWYLLRRLTDKVVYERSTDERNCLLIVKYAS